MTDIDPIPQDQYLPPKYQLTAIDAQHVQVNGQSKERFPSTDRSNSEATPLYHAVEPDIERSTINSESLNSEFFMLLYGRIAGSHRRRIGKMSAT